MKIEHNQPSDTLHELIVNIDQETLIKAKAAVIKRLSANVKIAGFRAGKAPAHLMEKALDEATLQSEFIKEVVYSTLYPAIQQEKVEPLLEPQVEISKFVPFDQLEYKVKLTVLGKVKLADYKNIKTEKPEVKILKSDIDTVLGNIQTQLADKTQVDRPSKDGDQVWIDFDGTDDKGQPVNGASGKDYPLVLGSSTFIPGFEENLIGLKKDEETEFKLTFPKDYGVKALQNKKVTFSCKIKKVLEIKKPAVDAELIKKINPNLTTVKELRDDIKNQLKIEKEKQADIEFENNLIKKITEESDIKLPEALLEQQIDIVKNELNQNLIYRGLTQKEYLENYGLTEEEHFNKEIKPEAERRLKAGLILSEIAKIENLKVTPEEVEIRLQVLKNQYPSDPTMQAELNKPQNRQDISSRLLTEKTIALIKKYATS